jgi:hypothetical protein
VVGHDLSAAFGWLWTGGCGGLTRQATVGREPRHGWAAGGAWQKTGGEELAMDRRRRAAGHARVPVGDGEDEAINFSLILKRLTVVKH